MFTAIVVLNVERQRIDEIAKVLIDIHGVTEVFIASGNWELIAIVRTHENDEMTDIITEKMLKVDGIQHSETMYAFRTYSHYDPEYLEYMFSVGEE